MIRKWPLNFQTVFEVLYQSRKTVFNHISNTEKRVKNFEVFLTNFEVFDISSTKPLVPVEAKKQ